MLTLPVHYPGSLRRLGIATVAVALLAACGGAEPPAVLAGSATTATVAAPQPTIKVAPLDAAVPGASATAVEAAAAALVLEPRLALEHVRVLSQEIGSRPAGTTQERAAADYIAETLRAAGYDVTIEEFPFEEDFDRSSVTVAGVSAPALAMRGGADGTANGMLVFAGVGETAELAGVEMRGRVVLFDRGVVPFSEKARAAEAAGAVAVIVVNHEAGPFRGNLGDLRASIPVVAVAGDLRPSLVNDLGQSVTVSADGGMKSGVSQNVVAKAGGECRAYLGAHYDSVPEGPGANDNATGVAVILEVARVNRVPGLCVVAFGAEETGLWGSRAYVSDHLAGTARFMLNVDMAGILGGPVIVGDRVLTDDILKHVEAAGIASPLRAGSFPPFSSSDHVSFSAVGVPAVTFNSGDDPAIHTPEDAFERVEPATLTMFVQAVDAALRGLLQ
ncbi:MAG: hypothetical protein CVU47_02885 [Chloroflexi bacterium HGW-Chloroflexi-9]|nr:MAG: hypothetical protein CVU47_02885 [Chloroflexi bacterium HGW-Chloroflexi-9]